MRFERGISDFFFAKAVFRTVQSLQFGLDFSLTVTADVILVFISVVYIYE